MDLWKDEDAGCTDGSVHSWIRERMRVQAAQMILSFHGFVEG